MEGSWVDCEREASDTCCVDAAPLPPASTGRCGSQGHHGPHGAVRVSNLKLAAHRGSAMRPSCSGADGPEAEIALAEHV